MAGPFPHVSKGELSPRLNRRTFITASTAAAIGFGADSILTAGAQEKEPMDPSTQSFWLDKTRLVIFIYHIDDISRDEPFTVTVKRQALCRRPLHNP